MTFLSMAGFETRYVGTQGLWTIGGTSPIFVAGRFGGFALTGSSGVPAQATCTLATPVTGTLIFGGAYRPHSGLWGSTSTSDRVLVVQDSSGGTHLTFNFDATGHLLVRLGTSSGTIIATSSNIFPSGSIYGYLEVKMSIADAGGVVVVKWDGVTVINFSGDTRNAGTANIGSVIALVSNTGGQVIAWDDIYVLDTVGSAPYNDFLGDVKVETLVPNGNGNSSQLVGSDGNSVNNYQQVDELPVSVADYNGSAVVGDKDTYTLTDLSTGAATVYAVQTSALCFKSDAGAASMKVVERASGGTERDSTAAALTATPGAWVVAGPTIVDPASAAWTVASVNAMEAGVKVA